MANTSKLERPWPPQEIRVAGSQDLPPNAFEILAAALVDLYLVQEKAKPRLPVYSLRKALEEEDVA